MLIKNLTQRDVLLMMGGDATDVEAQAMHTQLVTSGYQDTEDISDSAWQGMIREAVFIASNPLLS